SSCCPGPESGASAIDQSHPATVPELTPEVAGGLAELGEDDGLLAADDVVQHLPEPRHLGVAPPPHRGEAAVERSEPLVVALDIAAEPGEVHSRWDRAEGELFEGELQPLRIAAAPERAIVGGDAEEPAVEGVEECAGIAEL